MSAHGKTFHDNCFNCQTCNGKLVLGKSCETKSGDILCTVCYNSNVGPKYYGFTSAAEGGGEGLNQAKRAVEGGSSNSTSNSNSSSNKKTSDNDGLSGLDQIEKLGDLLKKGILSQSEFDAKKKQILGL